MPRVLIVAYGNPLRGDDGVGWIVAEQLQRTLVPPEVEILKLQQLVPEIAEELSHANAVIFVDASCDGVPGEIRRKPVTAPPGKVRFSHHLSPADVLELARQLYGAAPQAFCISLTGHNFGHNEELSPTASAQLPQLAAVVEELAKQILEKTFPAS
jgi:hydrogenase maturation protease